LITKVPKIHSLRKDLQRQNPAASGYNFCIYRQLNRSDKMNYAAVELEPCRQGFPLN